MYVIQTYMHWDKQDIIIIIKTSALKNEWEECAKGEGDSNQCFKEAKWKIIQVWNYLLQLQTEGVLCK